MKKDKYLNILCSMLKYNNLPETIDEKTMLYNLFNNGYTIWFNINEDEITQNNVNFTPTIKAGIYAMYGGTTGPEDFNGNPITATVSHPNLKQTKMMAIGEECVLMKLTPSLLSFDEIINKYINDLTETELTLHMATIMSRATSLITTYNDNAKKSADEFLRAIERGDYGVMGGITQLQGFEGVSITPFMTEVGNQITNLIELQQYNKASLWNELGLNANWNAKRETISSHETELNHDALLPLIDVIMSCQEKAINEINKMFNLNISVELSGAWKKVKEQDLIENKEQEEELIEEETETATPEEVEETEAEEQQDNEEAGEEETETEDKEADKDEN